MSVMDNPSLPPVKPDTRVLDVNLTGVLYTAKLAMHYFRRQPIESNRDRCLILKASMAAYGSVPEQAQYCMSKYGVRALMRVLRSTSWRDSIRVNLVAPWYIKTPMTEQFEDMIASRGIKYALSEDACAAMLRIASDSTINGRALAVLPREDIPEGYMDFAQDDTDHSTLISPPQL